MNSWNTKVFYRIKWSVLYRLRKQPLYHHFFFRNFKNRHPGKPVKLHFGCGHNYLTGWINIDINKLVKADLYMNMKNIHDACKDNTVDEIQLIHSISYLRYWEAVDFLTDCYHCLKNGGRLIMEMPDISKLSKEILSICSLEQASDRSVYFECLRAVYAFSMDQIKKKEFFSTYAFGWSAMHLKHELEKIGFCNVKILEPQRHDKLSWRDSRIEASK